MADSIREKIFQNLETTLEAITTGNGYNNTVQGVFRYLDPDYSAVNAPYIEITPGDETKKPGPMPYMTCDMPVMLAVFYNQDQDANPGATCKYINGLLSDIEKALMIDNTRGGFAIDTKIEGNALFDLDGDNNEIQSGISVFIEIQYRHLINNPESQ